MSEEIQRLKPTNENVANRDNEILKQVTLNMHVILTEMLNHEELLNQFIKNQQPPQAPRRLLKAPTKGKISQFN